MKMGSLGSWSGVSIRNKAVSAYSSSMNMPPHPAARFNRRYVASSPLPRRSATS